jgi:hypothetical protein
LNVYSSRKERHGSYQTQGKTQVQGMNTTSHNIGGNHVQIHSRSTHLLSFQLEQLHSTLYPLMMEEDDLSDVESDFSEIEEYNTLVGQNIVNPKTFAPAIQELRKGDEKALKARTKRCRGNWSQGEVGRRKQPKRACNKRPVGRTVRLRQALELEGTTDMSDKGQYFCIG